jgi:hypothetical protein
MVRKKERALATGIFNAGSNVGHVLQWTGSHMIPFFIASSAYLFALLFIHLLSPRLIPALIGHSQ